MNGLRKIASGGGLLLIAAVLGLVTAAATLAWLSAQEGDSAASTAAATNNIPGRMVVVAREEIPAGIELTSAMLELREIPITAVLSGALTDLDELENRTTRYPITIGEQLLESKLVGGDGASGVGLAYSVPAGLRAASVQFSEIMGAGGLIVPGDRVDVMVSTDYGRLFGPEEQPEDDVAGHPTVVTILQDMLVLAVGQSFAQPLEGDRDPATLRDDAVEAQPSAVSVTLAVTADQAQTLFLASREGSLGLTLRSFGDSTRFTIDPLFKLEQLQGTTGLASAR